MILRALKARSFPDGTMVVGKETPVFFVRPISLVDEDMKKDSKSTSRYESGFQRHDSSTHHTKLANRFFLPILPQCDDPASRLLKILHIKKKTKKLLSKDYFVI